MALSKTVLMCGRRAKSHNSQQSRLNPTQKEINKRVVISERGTKTGTAASHASEENTDIQDIFLHLTALHSKRCSPHSCENTSMQSLGVPTSAGTYRESVRNSSATAREPLIYSGQGLFSTPHPQTAASLLRVTSSKELQLPSRSTNRKIDSTYLALWNDQGF